MGSSEVNQMKQALIRQGMQPFKLEGMSEEQLRKMCNEKLSQSLTNNSNWGNTDGFSKQYKYNITYTLPDGEKIKVARIAISTLPSGRKVETFIDIAGNQYFQYRAADNKIIKEDYFKKQEKMFTGDSFKFANNKLYKTDIMGNLSVVPEMDSAQQSKMQTFMKQLRNLPGVKNGKTAAEFKKEIDETRFKGWGNPDKKVENIRQGLVGDCVLLAEIIANANNNIGEEYIKNAFSYNKNGDIVVSFLGLDKSIVVPKKELYNPTGARGDLDGSAIEKAVYLYIKQRQEDVENGAGPDIIEKYYRGKCQKNYARSFTYFEISGFDDDVLTYMLTGCNSNETIRYDDYKDFYMKYKKNPDKYIATVHFGNRNNHWYSFIKEQLLGSFGKAIVTSHAYGVKEFKRDEIVINNPWAQIEDLNQNIDDLNKDYRFYITTYETDNFLQKPETVKNIFGGETIIYKRRNGNVARTIEKNPQGQLVKIQEYDNTGRVTGLQEYENGQKVKLTYYHEVEEPSLEEIQDLENDGFSHEEALEITSYPIETCYFFKNNKVLGGLETYKNGKTVEIPKEDC